LNLKGCGCHCTATSSATFALAAYPPALIDKKEKRLLPKTPSLSVAEDQILVFVFSLVDNDDDNDANENRHYPLSTSRLLKRLRFVWLRIGVHFYCTRFLKQNQTKNIFKHRCAEAKIC